MLASRPPFKNDQLSSPSWALESSACTSESSDDDTYVEKKKIYLEGLLENLMQVLDKWIINGSKNTRMSVYNLLAQIEREAVDEETVKRAKRMVKRAGLPVADDSKDKQLGNSDAKKRRNEAQQRKNWEASRTSSVGSNVSTSVGGRSALSRRAASSSKPDLFLQNVDRRLDPQSVSEDKKKLERMMNESEQRHNEVAEARAALRAQEADLAASARMSEHVAKAGAGNAFEGERLGIGGLDDVLSQVKRRVWTPLAAPPQLLNELGIQPVRGLLLYGRPGCGKTLMAKTIGKLLSPARPVTVVPGPAIMDKFVGSSEKNLREVFDNPPDIYEQFRVGEADGGDSIAANALHVVVFDEFDAIARARGGRGSSQGDAGVARDSLVNQLLTCLDGVDPPVVPTFVVGLTNKRSLIDPALLRPGRFEVQIEVPPPRTNEQRLSILKVHTKSMYLAGRVLVADAPADTAAARYVQEHGKADLPTYQEFLLDLAEVCDGMSGASLAGVARAAASHALERVVGEYSSAVSHDGNTANSMMDCLVTRKDFDSAIQDVNESAGDADWELTDDEQQEEQEGKDKETVNGESG